MAGYGSNYFEGKILDEVWRGIAWSKPTTHYYGLITDTNTPAQRRAGTLTEVSTSAWTNYARVPVAVGTALYGAPSGDPRAIANTGGIIDFGVSVVSGTPPVVQALVIWDAPTGGNIITIQEFASGRSIPNATPVDFQTSGLAISVT